MTMWIVRSADIDLSVLSGLICPSLHCHSIAVVAAAVGVALPHSSSGHVVRWQDWA